MISPHTTAISAQGYVYSEQIIHINYLINQSQAVFILH